MPRRILTEDGSFSSDTRRKINDNFLDLFAFAASGQGGALPTEPEFETVTLLQDTLVVGGHTVQVTGPVVLPQQVDVPVYLARIDQAQIFQGQQEFAGTIKANDPLLGLAIASGKFSAAGHEVTVAGPATIGGGPVGASGGPFSVITSITVVNGIVTAITGA